MAVFGSGLGHAARMCEVVEVLRGRMGVEVLFSASGDAVGYLRAHGEQLVEVPVVDAAWAKTGSLTLKGSVRSAPWGLGRFGLQVARELDHMGRFRPRLVLSDSRLSATLAARLRGVEVLTVLNQIRVLLSVVRRPVVRFLEFVDGEVLGLGWALSRSILVPDLPPPYTISHLNLWGTYATRRKVRYVGLIAPMKRPAPERVEKVRRALEIPQDRPFIYAPISGPRPTKMPFVRALLRLLTERVDGFTYVVSAGLADGSKTPVRLKGGWYYEWCPVRDELFSLADLVIIRGGLTTISQALCWGKPSLLVPIPGHTEQTGNARKVDALGAGVYLDPYHFSRAAFLEALDRAMGEEVRQGAERMSRVVSHCNGVETIARMVEEYLRA